MTRLQNVRDTSIRAYHAMQDDGSLTRSEEAVLDALRRFVHQVGRPLTRRELSKLSGLDIAGVSGRINSLIAKGRVQEGRQRRDTITGKTAYELIAEPAQRELFA